MSATPPLPPDLVADLFRHRHAAMVAGLCRILGPQRLELAEDVVQEALLRALRVWPVEGVPEQPEAWVFRVARNGALDSLRLARIGARVDAELQPWAATAAGPPEAPATIADDTLRMLFLCSHPDVPTEARVPLLLKHVRGLGVPAIARAPLQQEATIAQRLTRAKAKLQQGAQFELPPTERLPARLCALLLQQQPALRSPRVHALLALILLLGARSPARTTADGELVPLAQQDRSRWDRAWLQCGCHHFRASLGGEAVTPFHVEAAIASVHAAAPDYSATDWSRILRHYDQLLAMQPSPIVHRNRAVALGKVQGARAGLTALAGLDRDRALRDYGLLHAVSAQLHWELGDHVAAGASLRQALLHPCSEPERRLLERRLAACERGEPVGPW